MAGCVGFRRALQRSSQHDESEQVSIAMRHAARTTGARLQSARLRPMGVQDGRLHQTKEHGQASAINAAEATELGSPPMCACRSTGQGAIEHDLTTIGTPTAPIPGRLLVQIDLSVHVSLRGISSK